MPERGEKKLIKENIVNDGVYHGDFYQYGKGYVCQHCGEIVMIKDFLKHYKTHREEVRKNIKEKYEREHPFMTIGDWDTQEAVLKMKDNTIEVFMEIPVYVTRPGQEKITRWRRVAPRVNFDNIELTLMKYIDKYPDTEFDSFKIRKNKEGKYSITCACEEDEDENE